MALHAGGLPDADQRHQFSGEIGTREDPDDARHRRGGRGIDPLDHRMRLVAVQNDDMRHIWQTNVGGEFRGSVQQIVIEGNMAAGVLLRDGTRLAKAVHRKRPQRALCDVPRKSARRQFRAGRSPSC